MSMEGASFRVLGIRKLCGDGVEAIREIFERRKIAEKNLISSHGEAAKYFVAFLDNHDQPERFNHPFLGMEGAGLGKIVSQARFYSKTQLTATAETAALFVSLAPMEIQVLAPAV
jgi:hypothetical protein